MQSEIVALVLFVALIALLQMGAMWHIYHLNKQVKLIRLSSGRTRKTLANVERRQDLMIDKVNELIEELQKPPAHQPTEKELKEAEFIYGLQRDDHELMAFINKEALQLDTPVSDEYAKSWNHLEKVAERSRGARESDTKHGQRAGLDLRELEPTGPVHLGGVRGVQEPPEMDVR